MALTNPAPCRSRLREHGAGVQIRSFGTRYNTLYLSRKGNATMNDHELFELGDVVLQEGATLRDAKLAYKTYGTLNDDKSNAIVYPTWYSGRHWENEWLIGEGMALDPTEYFIIVPNMLGNGLSSSPSNTTPPYDKARFPRVTVYDNVSVQHRLITEHFGIQKLVLVTGWSMGAGQTYQWALSHPEMVPRILPFCGSAKTSLHNIVFSWRE